MLASSKHKYSKTLAFPDTYYELIINVLQSVELFCAYDDSHDFADFEHLNAYGAQKLTAYIGNMAVNQYGIKSDTAKSELSRWKKSVKRTKKALKMAREYTDRREAQVVGEYEAAK